MLVDIHANRTRVRPRYELETFYGQLEHIFVIEFAADRADDIGLDGQHTIILAAVRNCILKDRRPAASDGLDIHIYTRLGPLHFLDIMGLQCLVGRVKDDNEWSIFDRSGTMARADYVDDGTE